MLVLLISACAYADNIYVSCKSDSGTIEKFDSSGNRSTFVSGLIQPAGLTFDRSGNLYVSIQGDLSTVSDDTVEKFDSSGNRTTFASGLAKPRGLAFDSSGNLYVANWSEDTIRKFDSSGNGSIFVSSPGGPTGLAFDSYGNLYSSNGRYDSTMYKYNSLGELEYFAWDYWWGYLRGAFGLAFDRNGFLYAAVTDGIAGGSITKFDPFQNAYSFASLGSYFVSGLAFDSSGYLYSAVVDGSGQGTIYKFDSSGNSSIFASGLENPWFIAIEPVPEPATLLILGFGGLAVLRKRRA